MRGRDGDESLSQCHSLPLTPYYQQSDIIYLDRILQEAVQNCFVTMLIVSYGIISDLTVLTG